jgi:methionyl-tRNA formyltransferase
VVNADVGALARPGEASASTRRPRSTRTVAVTQSDPFFTGRFFRSFLAAAGSLGVDLVEIVVLPNFSESRLALLRRMARFYGVRDLARLAARYLRVRVEELRGTPQRVEAIARSYGVPVRYLESINDPGYLGSLGGREIDVLLSVSAPEIFRLEALRAVPHVLNVHSGHIARYRGHMPTFWALLEGDQHVVVTVHEMVERLDAGPVVAEYPLQTARADSVFDVACRAKHLAGREVATLLAKAGTADWPTPRPIDGDAGRRYPFPVHTDAKRLRAQGRSLL